MPRKIGRPQADWLRILPKGIYTIEELIERSGKSKSTIVSTLKYNKVKFAYFVLNGQRRVLYFWDGCRTKKDV